jgi:hypothetical protein
MAIVPNIINMVAGINQRKRSGRVRDVLSNSLNAPPEEIERALMDRNVDPELGLEMRDKRRAEEAAAREKSFKMFKDTIPMFRGVEDPEKIGTLLDGISPALAPLMGETGLSGLRAALMSDPSLATRMDEEAWKGIAENKYKPYTLTAGSKRGVAGKQIDYQPFQTDTIKVKRGDGGEEVVMFDPNPGGGFVTDEEPSGAPGVSVTLETEDGSVIEAPSRPVAAGAPGRGVPLTVEAMRPVFVAQESDGDYTAVNAETGALGAYQVMPKTGATLAGRLGMVWNPALMRSNTPEGRRYQDAIGGAAIQEAIQASGGDPRTMAMYYHGGSDRGKWGPRTRKYAEDILGRVGGGGVNMQAEDTGQPAPAPGVSVSRTRVSAPGAGPDTFRSATPAELAGYPSGTAAQVNTRTGQLVNIKTPPAARSGGASGAAGTPKQQADAAKLESNKVNFGKTLENLTGSYLQLRNIPGAITRSDAGAGSNISAFFNTSMLGQTLGRMTGDNAQAIRDYVTSSRSLLMTQLKGVTGMSAAQLNSDRDISLMLESATDPTKEVATNLAAIHALDVLYGSGGETVLRALPPDVRKIVAERSALMSQQLGRANSERAAPRVGQVVKGYRYKGGDPANKSSWEKVQ